MESVQPKWALCVPGVLCTSFELTNKTLLHHDACL